MKKIYNFLLLFFIIINSNTFGQTLSKKYIDDWVKGTYITPTISQHTYYLFDGFLMDIETLDTYLSNVKINDLSQIIYVKKRSSNIIYCDVDHGAILISTFDEKQKENIRKDFKKVQKKIKVISPKKYPSLIINNILIGNNLVKAEINKIKPKSIIDMNIIDVPTNEKKYGPNGKNGLIIIYTKKPTLNTTYKI